MIRIKKFKEVMNLEQRLEKLKGQIAKVAQKVYDEWEQDETGYDEVYGAGGICDAVADEICDVLNRNRIDCFSLYNEYDYHTSAYAYDENKQIVYKVDIPPYVYESGSGYTWTKLPDIKISTNDVIIEEMEWEMYFDEDGNMIEY